MRIDTLILIGIFIGLFTFGAVYIYSDFANAYGFNNETDSRFSNMVNVTQIYADIESAKTQALQTDSNLGLVELIFKGGYFAINSFMSLPIILNGLVNNAFGLLGVPAGFLPFFYAIISVVVLFGVLYALGVGQK